mmetsp:Transcript_11480/g.21471  ORF Transcript_11480/g.21471 Transcript_11480/m.21471 type:complete len:959 (+) Transcript_11480:61-2937(+)
MSSMSSPLMNEFDIDGGIDWSSVKFPGEEEGLLDNQPPLLCPRDGTTETSTTDTKNNIMNDHPAIHLSLCEDHDMSVSETQGGIGNIASREVLDSAHVTILVGQGNNNFVATNSGEPLGKDGQNTMLEMKQKIELLEKTVMDKDARLFDLESTVATVEAEASYQIQQSQVQLQQQLRAYQDQLRQLEKDLDSKNQMIVKLKKRSRKEESQSQVKGGLDMEHVDGPKHSTSSLNNQITTSNGKNVVRQFVGHDDDSNDFLQYDHGNQYNRRIVESSPSTLETFQNNIPCRKRNVDYEPDVDKDTMFQSYNIDKDSSIRDESRTISAEEAYKCEETTRVLLHLIHFIERLSNTQCSIILDQQNHSSANVNNTTNDNNTHQKVQIQINDNDESQVKLLDGQEETNAIAQFRNLLLCLVQYCNVPDICVNHAPVMDETKSMVYSHMKNNKVNMTFVSKEIVVMAVSIQETYMKRNDKGSFLHSCCPYSLLCILKEFCIVSKHGRTCICNWICRSSPQSHDIDKKCKHHEGGQTKDKDVACRIRGLPEEYREIAQTVHLGNRNCTIGSDRIRYADYWWNDDFDIVCDLFRNNLLSCIIGPNPEEYNALSRQQRVRALSLQTISLECLCVIIQYASNSQLLVFYELLFNDCKQDSTGSKDIISVLEHNTFSSMNKSGHRHALIKDDLINEFNFSDHNIDAGESPDIGLIKVKRKVLQLLSRLFLNPCAIHSVSKVLESIYYRDSVSNLKRIVAALLDDLQAVILPILSNQDSSMDLQVSALHFASDIFYLLSHVSYSLEGFDLVRTQMRYFTKNNTKSSNCSPGSSCIAMGVDLLELSTMQLLLYPPVSCMISNQQEHNTDARNRKWLGFGKLVQTLVSFFYTIHSRCHLYGATAKSNTTTKKESLLLFILLDINRYHSFTDSCRKIASLPQSCVSNGFQRTIIDSSIQLKAKILVQAIADDMQ